MLRFNDDAGAAGHGSDGFSNKSDGSSPGPQNRGRVRGDDFGLPARAGLIDLARTYLDAQARLWPELVGTAAVPVAMPATIEPMADDFERRFRQQHAEVFRQSGTPKVWTDLGIAYLRFSDEGSNPRSLDQQLNNVLNRAHRDGIFIPWQYVCADAAVSGTLSCRRGYAIAKMLVERRAETGAACFVIDDLSRMSRSTIESAAGGGAGVFSVGLIRSLQLEAFEACTLDNGICIPSDCKVSQCLWLQGYAVTDPGWMLRHG